MHFIVNEKNTSIPRSTSNWTILQSKFVQNTPKKKERKKKLEKGWAWTQDRLQALYESLISGFGWILLHSFDQDTFMCKLRYEAKTLEFAATSVASLHLWYCYIMQGVEVGAVYAGSDTTLLLRKLVGGGGGGHHKGTYRRQPLITLMNVSNYPDWYPGALVTKHSCLNSSGELISSPWRHSAAPVLEDGPRAGKKREF